MSIPSTHEQAMAEAKDAGLVWDENSAEWVKPKKYDGSDEAYMEKVEREREPVIFEKD